MPRGTFLAALTAVLCVFAVSVSAAPIAIALSVKGPAVLESEGSRVPLKRRMQVSSGDTVRTGEDATVQLVFNDRTRIVVGPQSVFVVDDVQIGRGNVARTFAVEAVSGTFRFLSGESPKETYSIATPTATMGIRGTEFDFTVVGRRTTSLVTFSGQVRICGRRNRCALVSGGCAAVELSRRGRFNIPESTEDRNTVLRQQFPYVVSQSNLLRDFRTRTDSCGSVAAVAVQRDERVQAPEAPVQRRATPVETVETPVEAPAPEPSAGFPGQSGANAEPGPSQGSGHERSREAGGLGKGHGKSNPNRGGNGNNRI